VIRYRFDSRSNPLFEGVRVRLSLVGLVFTLELVAGSRAVAQRAEKWKPVAWLGGCWELRAGTRVIREQWMPPLGGTMLGSSRTVVGDSTTEWEQLRIEEQGAGLVYVAHPSGQSEATFVADSTGAGFIAFSNPEHDFPQRISYRRVGRDSVVARIEGSRGGKTRGIDFPMARTACSEP
jgi:hypothetical protein